MTSTLEPITFSVSLSLTAHSQAARFRRYQTNPQKGKQVYLNTLAVYAANFYLQCLGFETELETSESWNPSLHTLMDIADLTVKSYGKIECRPVLPDAKTVSIPPEVWEGRIGYFAVRLNGSLREATLLGFTPSVRTPELRLTQLQSLDEFERYLPSVRRDREVDRSVRLGQWLETVFEGGWQTLETLLGNPVGNFSLALRGEPRERQSLVQGAKRIDWDVESGEGSAILAIALYPENGDRVGIRVQLHPLPENSYLPANVTLALLSSDGEILREVTSQAFDLFVQLPKFKCDRRDTFSIVATWENLSVQEDFIV